MQNEIERKGPGTPLRSKSVKNVVRYAKMKVVGKVGGTREGFSIYSKSLYMYIYIFYFIFLFI